jgi:hypothetical protein
VSDQVKLIAFVLALVGGVLALASVVRLSTFRGLVDLDVQFLLILLGGALLLLGALRGWKGPVRDGGALAIAGGVLVLLAGNDLAGALGLVGGILFLLK